jgi:uncharacterized protein (TIGR03032 family)
MGFAYEPGRFALGTNAEVWEFHDMPAVARKLDTPESPARHDAAFLPRTAHITGDIQIHEMVWTAPAKSTDGKRGMSKLWFVNTRFSCLATRSGLFNFVPRWKPRFISALAPEDRCHLNGVALRDGNVRYVTALGETDTPAGWRDNKRSGGVLIEVASDEIIVRGLSMPHSPRWHEGRLWVLDSGSGGVGVVDEQSGEIPGNLPAAGVHARVGFCRALCICRPVTSARVGGFQRHRDCGDETGGSLLRGLDHRHAERENRWVC